MKLKARARQHGTQRFELVKFQSRIYMFGKLKESALKIQGLEGRVTYSDDAFLGEGSNGREDEKLW